MTLERDSRGSARATPVPAPWTARDMPSHLEANHRIANSLQLLSALLSSEGRGVADPVARSALDVSVQRIAAIAGIHRQLYQTREAELVDLGAYLVDLVRGLQAGYCASVGHRRLHLEVDPATVPAEFATTLGVIVTELVINACKHAYAADERGDVEIAVAVGPAGFTLTVRDQGAGRPMQGGTDGLGSRILDLMARRLHAEGGYVAGEGGTAYRIAGPLAAS